jgi:hypothetical protein
MYVRLAYRWRGVVTLGYGDRMTTYYLLIATGIVHGTYGEKLLHMAKEKQAKTTMSAIFKARLSERPCVGKSIVPQIGWKVIQ